MDGWLDVFLTNGMRLEETYTPENAPTTHLFKNNRDGTFTDVTAKAGIARTGWTVGVCVGDYENDGRGYLFCTTWGHNFLWHNNRSSTFTDATKKTNLYDTRIGRNSGCSSLDFDHHWHRKL